MAAGHLRRLHGSAAGAVLALASLGACHTAPPARRGPTIAIVPVCSDFSATLYFEADSAALTREARALVEAALRRARGCRVTGVSVLGLADAQGDPNANLALSRRRADAVAQFLARHGVTNVEFRVAAAGAAGAETRSGEARPLRRRADVQFHLGAMR